MYKDKLIRKLRYQYYKKLRGKIYKSFLFQKKFRMSSPNFVKKFNFLKAKNFLEFVYHNNKYYKEKMDRISFKPSEINSINQIQELPVLSKESVKQNFNNLISANCNLSRSNLVHTSGTTGFPLRFYDDISNQSHICTASLLLTKCENGIDIFNPSNQLNIKNKPKGYNFFKKPNPFLKFFGNSFGLKISDIQNISADKALIFMKEQNINIFYGYSQSIFNFSKKVGNRLKETKLEHVICLGENLFPDQLDYLRDELGLNVIINYGNTECPRVGISSGNPFNYYIDLYSYHVEVINPDERGIGEIVVTNLNNRLFPFIRYKTGDRGSLSSFQGGKYPFPEIKNLSGRNSSFLVNTKEELVNSFVFTGILKFEYKLIKQFQVIQKKDLRILIKIVPEADNLGDLYFSKLRQKLLERMNDEKIPINFMIVDEILPSKNGKYEFFKTELDKSK